MTDYHQQRLEEIELFESKGRFNPSLFLTGVFICLIALVIFLCFDMTYKFHFLFWDNTVPSLWFFVFAIVAFFGLCYITESLPNSQAKKEAIKLKNMTDEEYKNYCIKRKAIKWMFKGIQKFSGG